MSPVLVDLSIRPAFHANVRAVLLVVSESAQFEVQVAERSLACDIPLAQAIELLGEAQAARRGVDSAACGLDGVVIELTIEADPDPASTVRFWSPRKRSQCAQLVRAFLSIAAQLPDGSQFEAAFNDVLSSFE
jgi:hypothetical protein